MEFPRQPIESHDRQIGELTDRLATVTDKLVENSNQLAENAKQLAIQTANINKLVDVTSQDATAIRQLAAIAEGHNQRLDRLDSGQ